MKNKNIISTICLVLIFLLLFPLLSACDDANGKSAYEIAVINGYTGSEADWLNSLKGDVGSKGEKGDRGNDGSNGIGIIDIKEDESGKIIIYLSDGSTRIINGDRQTTVPSNDPPKLNVTELTLSENSSFVLISDSPNTSYSSSEPQIINISDSGIISAITEGSAVITATAQNGKITLINVNSVSYTYERKSDGTLTITGYFGNKNELIIPSKIKEEAVTAIEKGAFLNSNIKSVVIPSEILSIGEQAFKDSKQLTSVTISDATVVDASSFEGTPWLAAQESIDPDIPPNYIPCNDDTLIYPTDYLDGKDVHQIGESVRVYKAPEQTEAQLAKYLNDGTPVKRIAVFYEKEEEPYGWSIIEYNGSRYYIRNSQLKIEVFTDTPSVDTPTQYKIIESDLCAKANGLDHIQNYSDTYSPNPSLLESINIEIDLNTPPELPIVLILHTHGTEAYVDEGVDEYSVDQYINSNNKQSNVTGLGKRLTLALEAKGIKTIHCDILHDIPDYNSAYDSSAETIKTYLKNYPSIRYVIDLHRDSVINQNNYTSIKPTSLINDQKTAQVMCVVGAGNTETSIPSLNENFALAQKLRAELNSGEVWMCRPTFVKDSLYNQHLAPISLLIEIGTESNTLSEAQNAVDMVANAFAKVILPAPIAPET